MSRIVEALMRLLGRTPPDAITRADRVLDGVDTIRVVVVPSRATEMHGSFRRADKVLIRQ